jgi:hypothetical protein
MPYQDTMVPFGPWMPDEDQNIKPGYPLFWVNGSPVDLDDAKNVVWTAGVYRPAPSPVKQGTALPSACKGASSFFWNDANYIFAGTATALYLSADGGTTWTLVGSGYTQPVWQFTQYGSCVYASNGVNPIQVLDLSQPSPTFGALSANAPAGYVLGVIRDFLVCGNITSSPIGNTIGPNVLAWSGLAAPTTWDGENTQQARYDQSGSQSLYAQYGRVMFIAEGEEMGLVFQETGVSRVQYVGGDVVFSFYTYERKRGLVWPTAAVQEGNTVFYLSADGFYATDGSSVQPIGYGKINRFFLDDLTDTTQVTAAIDTVHSCAVWTYPSVGSSTGWRQITYNYAEGNWTHADYAVQFMFQGVSGKSLSAKAYIPLAFDASNTVNGFTGAPTDCEVTTKFFRFDPSHHAMVVAVRPLTDNANTTAGVAAINQDSDPFTFKGYTAPEPISRQISIRADGYAHAVNVKIPGAFTYCQGVGMKYTLRGSR